MIAFGCSITSAELYNRYAGPGIRRTAEPDSIVHAYAAIGSVARTYNLMLESVEERPDLEALVLLHQDAEIADAEFCAKLRRALSDPRVAVVGSVGAIGAPTIAWWEGAVTWETFARCYPDYGEDELPALNWNGRTPVPHAPLGEVDTLDGFVLALSPWAVRELRFDETLDILHGFDYDFCLQARRAGRAVVAADLRVLHHHSIELVTDPEAWMEAHARVAEKWEGHLPHLPAVERDPRQRAWQAEAEAGVARLAGASKLLQAYARADEHQKELKTVRETASWRLTEPLRRANALRRTMLASAEPADRSTLGDDVEHTTGDRGEQVVLADRLPGAESLEAG